NDDINGDVYITGDIRMKGANFMWKTEGFTDTNSNGLFDFGEPFADTNGQEASVYNFGTEASGTVSNRAANISSANWQTTQPNLGGSPPNFTSGAPPIGAPNFTTSMAAVTVNVGDAIAANGTAVTIPAFGATIPAISGKAINDVSNPAHIFIKANASEIADLQGAYHAGYVNNGLPTYILGDIALRQASPNIQHGITIDAAGNNQVYLIEGNLCIGAGPIKDLFFKPPTGTDPTIPIRVTFIVKGNVIVNDNITYRHGSSSTSNTAPYNIAPGGVFPAFGTSAWNPYDDAFALIALVNENAETNSGNVQFSDLVTRNLDNVDAIMYAENNFESRYGYISDHITINGMMLAGNQVRLNQEYVNGAWHARPESARNEYTINFDSRIRSLLTNSSWLPGLPGGTNRNSPPPALDPDDYLFDTILSSSNH
ncbi:MAG: hypothetical protein AABZ60_02100, partial [Planctomycetota bacterium]